MLRKGKGSPESASSFRSTSNASLAQLKTGFYGLKGAVWCAQRRASSDGFGLISRVIRVRQAVAESYGPPLSWSGHWIRPVLKHGPRSLTV